MVYGKYPLKSHNYQDLVKQIQEHAEINFDHDNLTQDLKDLLKQMLKFDRF